ncbi:hypothetical protein [Hyalangium gracile]|nr:hypothetical protein [Hyalangium gracile]
MNPTPRERNPTSHTSVFQLILVALALLGSMLPSARRADARG